ncbi:MAG TPA: lysophospholipid acyltransferase family protein [Candidatus Xenobia bacterium]|nr:lysophospholipid acyltransferase family protein [Candidatus Xenobia bacterium]
MSRALPFLRATVAGGFAFLGLYLLATPFVLHARLTGRIEKLYSVALWIVRNALRLAGVKIEVTGRENFPGRTCVYMANHQSNIDPPILFVTLPPRIAMMGKKQVFSIPVLGTALRAGDFVPVHREDPEEARESVEVALEKLRRGVSFLVYPEGHRSWDGRLLPFKHGVFVLAIRGGVPIVPITLDGATGLMPKGKWEIYPGVVRVTIHPPVETAHRRVEERRQLGREVRAIIASALPPELRGEPAPAAPTIDSTTVQ